MPNLNFTFSIQLNVEKIYLRQVSCNIVLSLLSMFSSSLHAFATISALDLFTIIFLPVGRQLSFFPQTLFLTKICVLECVKSFFFFFLISVNDFGVLLTRFKNFAFVNLSVCFTLSIFLQTHIADASRLTVSLKLYVSNSYVKTIYTKLSTASFFTESYLTPTSLLLSFL